MKYAIPTIVIIGAYPHFRDGIWQTSGLEDPGDHAGATFDRFRVLAGSALAARYPESLLLLSGGAQKPEMPSCAAVLKHELSQLGISESRMLLEERSCSVHQQLYEIGLLAAQLHFGHMLIITNEWHHPRLKAMMEHAPKLEMWRELSWEPVAAEPIMLESGKREWVAMVEAERLHPRLIERIAMERQGVRQVKDGTYRYTPF